MPVSLRRLYLVGLVPALLALFALLVSVRDPGLLPGVPTVPSSFDGRVAASVARTLVRDAPDRAPGSPGSKAAAAIVEQRLRDVADLERGLSVSLDDFRAPGPDGRDVAQRNILLELPGRSDEAVLVVAARDDASPGPGLVDDAAGTGVIVALARALVGIERSRTFVFASIDGGTTLGSGARRLASRLPDGVVPVVVIAIDAPGAKARPVPVRFAGDGLARTPPSLTATAMDALAGQGLEPTVASAGSQLLDLVAPREQGGAQAPFVDRGLAAVQIGDGDGLPPDVALDGARLARFGTAVDRLLLGLDQSPRPNDPGGAHILLRGRVVPGWMIIVLGASLLAGPALVAAGLLLLAAGAHAPLRRAALGVLRAALPASLGLAGLWVAGALGLLETDPWRYRLGPTPPIGAPTVLLVAAGVALGLSVGRALRHARTGPLGGPIPLAVAAVALPTLLACAVVAFGASPYSLLLLVPAAHAWALLPILGGTPRSVRGALVSIPLLAPIGLVLVLRGDGPALVVHAIAGNELPGGVALAIAVAISTMALLLVTIAAGGAPRPRTGRPG